MQWTKIISVVTLGLCLWMTNGCSSSPRATDGGFHSDNPAAKIYAIVEAGQKKQVEHIPDLIEQLNSDDPAVRMYAIVALEKMTGSRKGYSPYDKSAERNLAITRWIKAYPKDQQNEGVRNKEGVAFNTEGASP